MDAENWEEQDALVHDSESSPDAAAYAFADTVLKSCPTAQCAASKCRRQTDKYGRGRVVICDACPKHAKTYLRCVMCKITIHVGCADSGGHTIYSWTGNWKCSLCSNKHTSVLGADAVGPVGPAPSVVIPSDPSCVTSSLQHKTTAATSDSFCTSVMQYENYEAMHYALRSQGFRVRNTNYVIKHGAMTDIKSHVYLQCPSCLVRVNSSAVNGEGDDAAWRVSVKPHRDSCKWANGHQDVPDCAGDSIATSSTILQHSYELSGVKGLLPFIESLGASGVPLNNFISICPTSALNHHITAVVVHPSTTLSTITAVVVHPSTTLSTITAVVVHPSTPCRLPSSGSNLRRN
jgi:hypothetical protein